MTWPKASTTPRLLALLLVLLHLPSDARSLEGTARSVLETWIDRLDKSSIPELRGYIASAFSDTFLQDLPLEQTLAFHQELRTFGPLEIVGVQTETPDSIEALLRSEKSHWFRVQLTTVGDPPSITGLLLSPVARPTDRSDPASKWETLEELATSIVEDSGIPGTALAWARLGAAPRVGVAGIRVAHERWKIEPGDRFHIGSITKSITATVLGSLVEDGALRWESKLGELLPDVEMNPTFAEVELHQLLRHRGRVPQHLVFDGAELSRLSHLPGSPTEQRATYVGEVLALDPAGEGFSYSNAGYSIAGYIAERVTGRSWEQLVRDFVFSPLELDSCGVGWPATPERPDQPRGHLGPVGNLRPLALDDTSLGAFMRPAGDLHCSASDLARYGLAHLAGIGGRDGVLNSTTIRELHRADGTGPSYAAGWLIDSETGRHHHNGTVGSFYSLLVVDPEAKMVAVFLANAGPEKSQPAALYATEQILEQLAP